MAFTPTTTRESAARNGLKVLVHGPAGAGKTVLCSTTGAVDQTIIVSAEAGLLSLRDYDIAVAEVGEIADVREVYEFLKRGDHSFTWVCLDSISEIAEKLLIREKERSKDPRAAYGELADQMFSLLRAFRDLPMNVYVSAKQERVEDGDTGRVQYVPSMPGRKLTQGISYLFDEVFALRVRKDEEGHLQRILQTNSDARFEAKDRSGGLELFEQPNLGHIHTTITGNKETDNG